MKWLVGLTVITVLIALYVVAIRPWMRTTAWGAAFLDKIEPFERIVYKNSESILWARFLQLLGVLLTLLTSLGSINLEPVKPFLPDYLQWLPTAMPLIVSFAGVVQEMLRRDTTKPLEIVAMRTDAPPEVKFAAAQAAAANAQAVAKVEEAKAA